jgi:hypothetical protein
MDALKKYTVDEIMAALKTKEKQQERDRRKYLNSQEARIQYAKVYYEANKEKILAQQRSRRAAAAAEVNSTD